MEYYVGLDVSLRQTSICVVDQAGSVVREGVVDSDPEAISAYVKSKARDAVRIGLETGPTSTWLWTELKRLGLPVICIDARHAKAVLKMQINKSDRNDAIGIARIMQTGWFKEVHVKDIDSHSVRALLASRALLVKIKRDLENHVRGHSSDSTARLRFNLEVPEPLVLQGGSPCHRGRQAIAPDQRSGGPSKTTACSDRSQTCPVPPASRG
jgi:transposase